MMNIISNNNHNAKKIISFERALQIDSKNNYIIISEEKILLLDFSENFNFFTDFFVFCVIN